MTPHVVRLILVGSKNAVTPSTARPDRRRPRARAGSRRRSRPPRPRRRDIPRPIGHHEAADQGGEHLVRPGLRVRVGGVAHRRQPRLGEGHRREPHRPEDPVREGAHQHRPPVQVTEHVERHHVPPFRRGCWSSTVSDGARGAPTDPVAPCPSRSSGQVGDQHLAGEERRHQHGLAPRRGRRCSPGRAAARRRRAGRSSTTAPADGSTTATCGPGCRATINRPAPSRAIPSGGRARRPARRPARESGSRATSSPLSVQDTHRRRGRRHRLRSFADVRRRSGVLPLSGSTR